MCYYVSLLLEETAGDRGGSSKLTESQWSKRGLIKEVWAHGRVDSWRKMPTFGSRYGKGRKAVSVKAVMVGAVVVTREEAVVVNGGRGVGGRIQRGRKVKKREKSCNGRRQLW